MKPVVSNVWYKIKSETLYQQPLDRYLKRDNNNLDFVRLILAAMVIYGHGFAATPSEGMGWDKIYETTGLYAGSIAIKGFFMISGLLVTVSLLKSGSVTKYAISRFFRIWPALCVCVLFLSFVVGPAVTSLSLKDYFSDPQLMTFIDKQIVMNNWGGAAKGHYDLPGVFENNAFPRNVNVPLWSIPAEVFCYIILALVFMLGGLNRTIATALFLIIVWDSLIPTKTVFFWITQGDFALSILPFCFALGAFCAVWRDKIIVGIWPVIGAIGLSEYFGSAHFGDLLKYGTVFVIILYVAGMPLVKRIKFPIDVSYGVYLYGWPVQQIYNQYFPDTAYLIAFSTSLLGAIVLATLSAYLVERPSLLLGSRLSKRVHTQPNLTES